MPHSAPLERQRERRRACDRHARIRRGVARQPDGADPETEARPPQQQVGGDGGQQRDQHAEVKLRAALQDREPRALREEPGLWDQPADRVRRLVVQRPGQHVVHHLDGDEVHHDRAQDLVDAEVALEGAGDGSPGPATDGAGEDRERDEEARGEPGQRERGCRRKQRAHCDLALAADVEDVRAERDADPHAHEQQRDGLHRRCAQRVAVAERSVEERAVAGDRTCAEREEHEGADEERGKRRSRVREPGQPEATPVEPGPIPLSVGQVWPRTRLSSCHRTSPNLCVDANCAGLSR